jgi:hypothetical protein
VQVAIPQVIAGLLTRASIYIDYVLTEFFVADRSLRRCQPYCRYRGA